MELRDEAFGVQASGLRAVGLFAIVGAQIFGLGGFACRIVVKFDWPVLDNDWLDIL